jgi:hypothetical protein
MLFISGGLLTIFAIVFVVTIDLVNTVMFERIQENVVQALEGAVKIIDTENFRQLREYEADPDMLIEEDGVYANHQYEIYAIRELFPQTEIVYTYVPGERNFEILWIGDSCREDETSGCATYFKEPYEYPEDVGFNRGLTETVPPDYIYTDEYGTWVSGITPILDENGNSLGALGIDINVTYLEGIENQVRASLLPPFGIITFLFLGVTWISAWITRRGGIRWPRYKVKIQRVE